MGTTRRKGSRCAAFATHSGRGRRAGDRPGFERPEKEKAEPARTDDVGAGFRAYIVAEPRFSGRRHPQPHRQDAGPLVTTTAWNRNRGLLPHHPTEATSPLAASSRRLDELVEVKDLRPGGWARSWFS